MNHHKKKKVKYYVFIGLTMILCLLFFYFFRTERQSFTKIESFAKDMLVKAEELITYPLDIIRHVKPTNQTDSDIIIKSQLQTLKQENQELRNLLELNNTITEYDIINATTISRLSEYWLQTITIDKGKKDGIDTDMIVITKYGLIGKINKVSNYTSEVKLITSNDSNYKISVEIITEKRNIPAILCGYDFKNKVVLIEGVDDYLDITPGQEVITSGLGGVFPKGIYVGEIKMIKNEKYDISQTLQVKTLQDFNDIHYVSILKGKLT